MKITKKQNSSLKPLEDKLNRLPFALAISDISLPDHPLLFVNSAFTELTGYGEEVLGTNCRFMQDGLDNEIARAEIRDAIECNRRCQVLLHNKRKNGETFYNLLRVENIDLEYNGRKLSVGCPFDMGADDPRILQESETDNDPHSLKWVNQQTQDLRVERRRVVTDAAVRLIQSWLALNDVIVSD